MTNIFTLQFASIQRLPITEGDIMRSASVMVFYKEKVDQRTVQQLLINSTTTIKKCSETISAHTENASLILQTQ
jgi:hypothetical protein